MATTEERMQILRMIEARQITAEEGGRLLDALDRTEREAPAGQGRPSRWFRVRVTDLRTGKQKVNVSIPLGLVEVGLRLGARFAPNTEGIDLDQIARAIREGTEGRIVDVEDEESAEHVEVYIE
ncbi:MAG: hypothetical protein K6V36_10590 [Anaerolineae bacterium]|nr:hypothetical protein [Anaerolineae bacterium]